MAHSLDHHDHITENGVTRTTITYERSIIHGCPIGDSGYTPCCDQTPFELPPFDRMTLDPDAVTCKGRR